MRDVLFQTFIFLVIFITSKCDLISTAVLTEDSAWLQFKKFQKDFDKHYYSTKEETIRFSEFKKTLKQIAELNSDIFDSAKYGINKFADQTDTERLMRRGRSYTRHNSYWDGKCTSCIRFPKLNIGAPPTSFNWTAMGAVTHIKDQGKCGNCWAFGATGDVEGVWFLSGHNLTSLSEQQLTSCDHTRGDEGCSGSDSDMDTFKYIQKNGGLTSEKAYPYCSGTYSCRGGDRKNGVCNKTLEKNTIAYINGSYQISGGEKHYDPQPINESFVVEVLLKAGPVTIGINSKYFDNYESGIMSPKRCKNTFDDLDHQVLIVGYGESPKRYWLIKNSWNTDWGENGYVRLLRAPTENPTLNTCGVASDVSHSYINNTNV